ncbi:MAG: hypothetical protein NW220_19755 [Leptolyngbyaceae cyanobacterium bins.349]|nr:hypothetical protein [Leptolyngbyaceae cyanobacterium bins.349]
MIYHFRIVSLLVFFATTIACLPMSAIAQVAPQSAATPLLPLSLDPSDQSPLRSHQALAGRNGVPRRRVGGGSRLY